jgi:tetratricopeptide (TPR) repeat protein
LHKFDDALGLLDRAIALQPLDGQAWLTRASLLELRGDYTGARRSCARLVRSADEVTALTCIASVDGRSGRLAASYSTLTTSALSDPRLPPDVLGWTLSVRADMAERLGDDRRAETDLRQALAIAPEDPYLRATYADLLLRLGRPKEVIALLANGEALDPLLLRLAIAGRRAGAPEAGRWASMYAERLRAAARDGDTTHRREEAMYLLDVADNVPAALKAASSNWALQREPADVRIYARATLAARSAPDRAVLDQWLAANHFEDRTLPPVTASRAGGAT